MFNIDKGDSFSLAKQAFKIGVGWDTSKLSGAVDVDVHAFGCVGGKFFGNGSHAVTYANSALKKGANKSFGSADDSITHTGDNLTGAGDGPDETIKIDTGLLPKEIEEIMVFVTLHQAKQRGQHFGLVDNVFASIIDEDSGKEICHYDLKKDYDGSVSIQIGSLTRAGDSWKFDAITAGFQNEGLGEILNMLK
jgi:tellurium resistance protein TerD